MSIFSLPQAYAASGQPIQDDLRTRATKNQKTMLSTQQGSTALSMYDYYGFPIAATYDVSIDKIVLASQSIIKLTKVFDAFGLIVLRAHDAVTLLVRDPILPLKVDNFNVPLKAPIDVKTVQLYKTSNTAFTPVITQVGTYVIPVTAAAPTPGPTPAPTAAPIPEPTPGPTPAPTPGPTPAPTVKNTITTMYPFDQEAHTTRQFIVNTTEIADNTQFNVVSFGNMNHFDAIIPICTVINNTAIINVIPSDSFFSYGVSIYLPLIGWIKSPQVLMVDVASPPQVMPPAYPIITNGIATLTWDSTSLTQVNDTPMSFTLRTTNVDDFTQIVIILEGSISNFNKSPEDITIYNNTGTITVIPNAIFSNSNYRVGVFNSLNNSYFYTPFITVIL